VAAIDALLALCAVPDRRDGAAAALSQLPAEALPHIVRGLAHTDPAVRRWTIEVLTRFRLPEATRALAAAFSDTDPGVRETAVVAIMRLGSTVFDDTIATLAQRDPSKAVRRAATAALAPRRSAR
jgi:HEAT repeat protein